MFKRFYITTPIYYVNASPHIGHSYTNIAADVLARYMRGKFGKANVRFLTGSDEHGQKIQKAADQEGLNPQEFVDKTVVQFRNLWETLGISYDDFIRTTELRHTGTVQKALDILFQQKDIYMAQYKGWYCIPCETFWTEGQVPEHICPDCKRPVERITENNYFFKMKKHQNWLVEYIESHPDFIRPEIRRNEILSFLKLNELTDLCISRPKERLSWGILLPFSPDHVTYVWFDALLNYISASGAFDDKGKYGSVWWKDDTFVMHLVGKDILRHHAVYWPIMLKALGIKMPDTIFAHGWWMLGQNKMSKSRGNVVSPIDIVKQFGIDAYRYFLMRDVPFGLDGNFSEEAIIKRYNSDLANDLGNLVYRTLTMAEKYFEGRVPNVPFSRRPAALAIQEKMRKLDKEVDDYFNARADFVFSQALSSIWELINMANKYVEDTKPWNLAKENKLEDLGEFLHLLIEVIRYVALKVAPFLPESSVAILSQIGEASVNKGKPLFPRLEIKKE